METELIQVDQHKQSEAVKKMAKDVLDTLQSVKEVERELNRLESGLDDQKNAVHLLKQTVLLAQAAIESYAPYLIESNSGLGLFSVMTEIVAEKRAEIQKITQESIPEVKLKIQAIYKHIDVWYEKLDKADSEHRKKIKELIEYLESFLSQPQQLRVEDALLILESLRKLYSNPSAQFSQLHQMIRAFKLVVSEHYPAISKFDLDTDTEAKRKKAQLILPYFYRQSDIADSIRLDSFRRQEIDRRKLFELLMSQELTKAIVTAKDEQSARGQMSRLPEEVIFDEAGLPSSEVYHQYFEHHSPDYVTKLDNLIGQSGKDETFLQGRKAVVAIPAMNETGLLEVIRAFEQSYQGDAATDIAFVIYHNSKDLQQLDPHVRTAVDTVKMLPNVVVFEEEVPSHNTTGMAKKTASDLAMRMMGQNLEVPLIMADADVVELSPGLIEQLLADLGEEGRLAAAPEFDYEKSYKQKYPVLGLLWDVRREIGIRETEKKGASSRHMTYGMCYAIKTRTLAMIGGIKPTEQFEDTHLTKELKDVKVIDEMTSGGRPYNHPVAPTNLKGGVVYINPDREISDIRRGNLQWSRWLNERSHQGISGMIRGSESDEKDHLYPELGDLTPDNFAQSINRSIPFVIQELPMMGLFGEEGEDLTWQSRETFRQLALHNIHIEKAQILIIANNKLNSISLDRADLDKLVDESYPNNWVLQEVESVTFNIS